MFARAFRAHVLGLRGKSYPPESAGVTSGPLRPPSRFRSSFDRSPASIRDGNATIGRLNRCALDCCEPATEEASQHVRCDAACEQERLRYSALTAGKQLKCPAPFCAKTTSSRGRRHSWRQIRTRETRRLADRAFPGPKDGRRCEIAGVLQSGHFYRRVVGGCHAIAGMSLLPVAQPYY